MNIRPIVVYGANGYTGRLICESLREYSLPFVAAARSGDKLKSSMELVPGIETADYEIVEVAHEPAALAELFAGRTVICNTVGPFAYFGDIVVEAAANAGCSYIDTTGEQAWMLDIRQRFGPVFAAKGTVLSPSTAYMHTLCEIAAQIVLETEGIDSIEAGCIASGIPTYASTQTIFAMFKSEQRYLLDNRLVDWEKGRGFEVAVPDSLGTLLGHPWGGGTLPALFLDDPRVRSARILTAFTDRSVFERVVALQQHYEANIKSLPEAEQAAALEQIANNMQPGMPPRENRLVHRTTDFALGRGSAVRRRCVIRSVAPYQATGILQAAAAARLVRDGPRKSGFASASEAFGHRYLLGALASFLPVSVETN